MSYVFENITQDDVEKILKDAKTNSSIDLSLKHRKYFENKRETEQETPWAINREIDCYFMKTPKIDIRSPFENYMFFFSGQMYRLVLTEIPRKLTFDCKIPKLQKQEAITELNKAYKTFGLFGEGERSHQWIDFDVEFVS
ncbi:MAG: hypothetical protein AAGB12_01770 [Pseudomonadota bacterium]